MKFNFLEHLPIFDNRTEIVKLIRSEPVLILSGETGSGKTTQLPLFCLEAGRGEKGRIGCTQPRRVAAQSIARFLSSQCDSSSRDLVGYKVRFREHVSDTTKVKFMTDGILLAEAASDPLLSEYDTIIIDEVHERSVNIDLLLGYLKLLLPKRPDLRVILSSATYDTRLFARFFGGAPIVSVEGRLFPVETIYKPVIELWKGESIDSYIEGVIVAIEEIISHGEVGDILAFLPTVDDIYDAINRLRSRLPSGTAHLLPLHSRSSDENQVRIFEHSPIRKIVIATNIAETSITIPGIRFVIDSGLARVLRYDSNAAISRMPIEKISRAAAMQRAGRCGRVQRGVCIRLYSEQDFLSRPQYTLPEIKRANCARIILQMHNLVPDSVKRFPFVQAPAHRAMSEGYRVLREMRAFDNCGNLTPLGKMMAKLPLDPPVSRMLLHSIDNGSFDAISVIAAALSVGSLTYADDRSGKHDGACFRDHQSDFITFVNIWHALTGKTSSRRRISGNELKEFCAVNGFSFLRIREWIHIHAQIVSYCGVRSKPMAHLDCQKQYQQIHTSLLAGMFNGVAVRRDTGLYEGTTIGNIRLFPGSTLFRKNPDWVLFHDIVETEQVYGRYAAVLRPQWIESLFKQQCRYNHGHVWYDNESGTVKCREEVSWRGLLVIKNRIVDYENKNRRRAVEVFIKEALVNESLGDRFRFIIENRAVKEIVFADEKKMRKRFYGGDIMMESFYEELLGDVCSVKNLLDVIRKKGNDSFLFITIDRIAHDYPTDIDTECPDRCVIAGETSTLQYRWAPGESDDGVTIVISEDLYSSVPVWYWDWAHPALVRQRIATVASLLECTDDVREQFILRASDCLHLPNRPFWSSIKKLLDHYTLTGQLETIVDTCPEWLWLRVVRQDLNHKIVKVERTPLSTSFQLKGDSVSTSLSLLLKKYECYYPRWQNSDLLRKVAISSESQLVPFCGYPALFRSGSGTETRVFLDYENAASSQVYATEWSIETALDEELAWCIESIEVKPLVVQMFQKLCSVHDVKHYLTSLVVRYVTGTVAHPLEHEKSLMDAILMARNRIGSAETVVAELLEKIIESVVTTTTLLDRKMRKNNEDQFAVIHLDLEEEINFYKQTLSHEHTPYFFLEHLPVYLTTFLNRIEDAFYDYPRYCSKMYDIRVVKKSYPLPSLFSQAHYYQWLKKWKIRYQVEEYISVVFTRSSIKLQNPVTLQKIRELAACD